MLLPENGVMELLQALHRLDSRLFTSIFMKGDRPEVNTCARALSRSAEGYLHALIPLLLYLLGATRVDELVMLICASLAVERVTYWLLKNGFKRRRPQDYLPDFRSHIVPGDKFSFPSGHTSSAFLLATALTIVYQGPVGSVFIWAAAIGLSRIFLGVHYPGDTVAGALMGSTIVMLIAGSLGV